MLLFLLSPCFELSSLSFNLFLFVAGYPSVLEDPDPPGRAVDQGADPAWRSVATGQAVGPGAESGRFWSGQSNREAAAGSNCSTPAGPAATAASSDTTAAYSASTTACSDPTTASSSTGYK